MKIPFLMLLISFCFLCKRKALTSLENDGKVNNISVIIDDQQWNGEIGDSIRNKFASPVIGLEEPLL
jgi:hypothetical protein